MSRAARRILAAVLVAGAAGLLAGTTGLLDSLTHSSNYDGDTESDRNDAFAAIQHRLDDASRTHPAMKGAVPVLLVIDSVDPGTRSMNVGVTLNLNDVAAGLADEKTKRPLAAGGTGKIMRLRVDDSEIAIPLVRSDQGDGVVPDAWPTAARGAVRLQGNPGQFPEDQYGVYGRATLTAPDGTTYRTGPGAYSRSVPIIVGFGADEGLDRWVVNQTVDERDAHYEIGPFQSWVAAGVWRPRDQVFLVYSVALAPLLIALIGAVLWAVRGQDMRATGPAVELGVAFLAVLPLRSVLVPSSITEMTDLDRLLAMQMILVVAGSACAVAWAILRRAVPPGG